MEIFRTIIYDSVGFNVTIRNTEIDEEICFKRYELFQAIDSTKLREWADKPIRYISHNPKDFSLIIFI